MAITDQQLPTTAPGAWLRPEILALKAYQVPDSRGLIKLDAMENPHAFPAPLRGPWLAGLHDIALNRYPDAGAAQLKSELRRAMGLPRDTALLLGNGSDEILQLIMLALAKPGASLVTPEPGFAMFRLICQATGLNYIGVPLAADFALDVDAMLAAIKQQQPALVIIAQPNNPTGNAFDREGLKAIVAAAPGMVVIDEAYYPFADSDCLAWLGGYENLLVMRTLSKLGLAGLRLGLLAGPKNWIDALEPLRLPYNINSLTQYSAHFALQHYREFTRQADQIRAERGRLAKALADLPGLTVYPSQANFLLLRVPDGQATKLHNDLRGAGVLVKNLHGSHPQVADCLRVTVGAEAENEQLLAALSRLLGK